MLNEILMPTGKMKELNVAVGASAPTVRKALRGKSMWNNSWGLVGVLGRATNTSNNPAPAYGGWFETLKANGLVLSTKVLEGTTGSTTLPKTTTLVVSAASGLHTITLPKDAYTGTTIFFKQWNTGYMRITPPSGQNYMMTAPKTHLLILPKGKWELWCL